MSNFVPIDDLFDKSDEDRKQYYLDACEFLGVPPELNLLKFFENTTQSGKRSLILYALRGATDIIRANRKISVDSISQHDGQGYISFTATGSDPDGRKEMATGVAHIEGLTGKNFENSVKRAQTEALRRMTLQFAGGGFLDESELAPQFETNIPANTSLAELAKPAPTPTVAVNQEKGMDITEMNKQFVATLSNDAITGKVPEGKDVILSDAQDGPYPGIEVKPEISADSTQQSTQEKPKRKYTRRRNTVTLESPGQAVPENPQPITFVPTDKATQDQIAKVMLVNGTPEQQKEALAYAGVQVPVIQAPVVQPTLVMQAPVVQAPQASIVPVEGLPTPEQQKIYRERLGVYANDVLPMKGGMMPVSGYGGVTMRLRAFAILQLGGQKKDVTKFTTQEWETFLEFLDQYLAKNGAKELVNYIDKALGVIQ